MAQADQTEQPLDDEPDNCSDPDSRTKGAIRVQNTPRNVRSPIQHVIISGHEVTQHSLTAEPIRREKLKKHGYMGGER